MPPLHDPGPSCCSENTGNMQCLPKTKSLLLSLTTCEKTYPVVVEKGVTINGLHLYSAFIQSDVQFMPLIHPFTHTHTPMASGCHARHQTSSSGSDWGLGVLLRDTFTHPGWIEPATLRLPDNCSYLLSHIARVSDGWNYWPASSKENS